MWRIVQNDTPGDYVLATGETHTVREFCQSAFGRVGIDLDFRGTGPGEIGLDSTTGREVIAVDPRYFRPTEVDLLLGDATKAARELGWVPRVGFRQLVEMMVDADLAAVQSGEQFSVESSNGALLTVVK